MYELNDSTFIQKPQVNIKEWLHELHEIAERHIFVTYKLVRKEKGKTDKVPSNGQHNLSYTEPTCLMPLIAALKLVNEWCGLHGVGLVFENGIVSDGWQLIGLDYDDVDINIFQLPVASYTERSPSGKGLHQFAWVPIAWAMQYRYTTGIQLAGCHHGEVYLTSRFLTVTGDRINNEPINRLTDAELAIIESWGLNPAKPDRPAAAPEIPDGGQVIDLAALPWLTEGQKKLINGTEGIDRSAISHNLMRQLIDAGHPQENILATWLQPGPLWQFCLDHRECNPERAVQYARDEIARGYAQSKTGMRDQLIGFGKQMNGGDSLPAKHLITDQANAVRLQKAVGGSVIHTAGKWRVWNGRHWGEDEPAAFRLTCTLSDMIDTEAGEWENKPHASDEERDRNQDIAKGLRKWSTKSEMLDRLNAANNLLRRLVTVPADSLDRDPYTLNVLNGTIDLRTGNLRPHDKADLITRCIPIIYDPKAEAPTFKRVLLEIAGGSKALADFLQRWFGYCATGVTSEQKFAVHHGDGANGKSLLLDTISNVLGPYAGTAAPNLLMVGGQNRHPAEIADLFGMRLVVAHESGEGGALREDFIKQATGSDKLKARLMRQDFFEFSPTHTLNLLTNHKPQIRGQDAGIWRRVMLVPYSVTFGTAAEVAQGLAHHQRNDSLGEKLKAEAAGILAWLVQGAVKWHMVGLNPPDIVLSASAEYRSEQDRVGQFLTERNGQHAEAWVPCDWLFQEYQKWCRGCEYYPLGKYKFIAAVEKRPGVEKKLKWIDWFGKKTQLNCFSGLKM